MHPLQNLKSQKSTLLFARSLKCILEFAKNLQITHRGRVHELQSTLLKTRTRAVCSCWFRVPTVYARAV